MVRKADNGYYWPEQETKKCEQAVNDLARHKTAYSNKLTDQLDNLRKKESTNPVPRKQLIS